MTIDTAMFPHQLPPGEHMLNPVVKAFTLYALNYIIAREPAFVAHKSPKVQKAGAEVVAAAKVLVEIASFM